MRDASSHATTGASSTAGLPTLWRFPTKKLWGNEASKLVVARDFCAALLLLLKAMEKGGYEILKVGHLEVRQGPTNSDLLCRYQGG